MPNKCDGKYKRTFADIDPGYIGKNAMICLKIVLCLKK